jgi:hypothetical protein
MSADVTHFDLLVVMALVLSSLVVGLLYISLRLKGIERKV